MPVRSLPHRVHFVGAGGAGMSAVAWVLLARGHAVSGSDSAANSMTELLAARGARIAVGHAAGNLGDAEAIVTSTAIPPANPELAEARRRGLPVLHRSQALAHILDSARGIAVAGTHGKTTTTSMAATALDRAGLDPTALIGGELQDYGGNAKVGGGEFVVAEADESDGSLLNFHPEWAIVTNIDLDHMDHYGSEANLVATFRQFLGQVRPRGGAILCAEDARLRGLRSSLPCRTWTYAMTGDQADYLIEDFEPTAEGARFRVRSQEAGALGEIRLRVPGRHNALNATAVFALAHRLGLDLARVAVALYDFRGAKRRFQHKGAAAGVTVIDDYAHHPTEIAATLSAARSIHPQGRIVAVFQPHRYTRTQHLWREFAETLGAAPVDALILTDIYAAGEAPIDGVHTRMIFDALPASESQDRVHCPTLGDVLTHLRGTVQPGDWVLTLGAGNVYRAGEQLLEALGEARVHAA